MGYRIRKAMGYGLQDLETVVIDVDSANNGAKEAKDPQIDLSCLYQRHKYDDASYLDHLQGMIAVETDPITKERLDSALFLLRDKISQWEKSTTNFSLENSYRAIDSIAYNNETGNPQVIILTPPEMVTDWTRSDDAIDYAESEDSVSMEPSVRKLSQPLFPYDGWMHALTGRTVTQEERYYIGLSKTMGKEDHGADKYMAVERLLRKAGFASIDDVNENCVPMVPASIKALVSWTGILTSNDVVSKLRPMVYTYWS